MCDPVTAITAASAVAGLVGQTMQINAAADHQNAQIAAFNRRQRQNLALAEASQDTQTDTLDAQEEQASRQDAQTLLDSNLRSRRAQATARAAAAKSGVSGLAVDALVNEFKRTEGRFQSATGINADARREQGRINREAIGTQTLGRVQSLQAPVFAPLPAPDYIGAALRIGGAGAEFAVNNDIGFDDIFGPDPLLISGGGR